MPYFDLKEQLHQDSLEAQDLKSGFRFAYKFITDYTPENSGIHFTTADGTRVWRLGIHSANAYSINLLFSKYELPEGASLFLYNADQTQIIGSFNHLNNSEQGILPIRPIDGDRVIVEYQEPENVAFHAIYNYDGKVLWASLRVENDTLITGYRITNGWARENYTYFAISFSQPILHYGYTDRAKVNYAGGWRRFDTNHES